jgi:hypothetical protein
LLGREKDGERADAIARMTDSRSRSAQIVQITSVIETISCQRICSR